MKGVRQIVVLGAGLDTFAYRLEPANGLRVFELDHPATQATSGGGWREAGIAEPAHVAYVAHDFESGAMTEALKAAGFEVERTDLRALAGGHALSDRKCGARDARRTGWAARRSGSRVRLRQSARQRSRRRRRETFTARWLSAWRPAANRFAAISTPTTLHASARGAGFAEIEDLDRAALVGRYLPHLPVTPGQGRAAMSCGWRRARTAPIAAIPPRP